MYGYGKPCQRCGKDASCKIMSMYSKAMICMECKDKETQRPDYKQAEAKDLREYAGRLDSRGMKPQANNVREAASKLLEDEEEPSHGMSELEREMGMVHGNRGLADYGGLELDRPGGTGCYGCGGRGCESCNWGEPD